MPKTTLSFAQVLIEELEHIEARREKILKTALPADEGLRRDSTNAEELDAKESYEVFRKEWKQNHQGKEGNEDELLAEARVRSLNQNLAGLAFSGGGIRSATFAIGVLQGLASLRMLRFFDFLSTVSGGGYAGGWLATWLRREGHPLNVERQLDSSRIRQAKAVRLAGNPIGVQVSRIFDEAIKPDFEELEKNLSHIDGKIDHGLILQSIRADIGEEIRTEVPRLMDGLAALPQDKFIALVHKKLGVVADLLRTRIGKNNAFAKNLKETRDRLENELRRSHPNPLECEPDTIRMCDVVDEEPEPIRHLRRYSSYMNPRSGIFSADSWTLGAIYTRNVLINLLLLLPLVMNAVFLARGVIWCYDVFAKPTDQELLTWSSRSWPALRLFLVGAVFMMIAFVLDVCALWCFRFPKPKRHGTDHLRMLLLCTSMFLGAVLVTMAYQPFLVWTRLYFTGSYSTSDLSYLGWINIKWHMWVIGSVTLLLSLPTFALFLYRFFSDKDGAERKLGFLNSLLLPIGGLGSGVTTAVLITLVEELLRPMIEDGRPWLRAMTGPPLLLLAIVIGVVGQVALLGRVGLESEREWWGRVAASMLLSALGWFAALGVIVYGPAVLLGSHQLISAALASGWVATTIAGVLAGKSGATSGPGYDKRLEWIARLAPPVFLIGLLAVVSTLALFLLNSSDDVNAIGAQKTFDRALRVYLLSIRGTSVHVILWWLFGSVVVSAVASWLVNVNLFSLNAMYANRLTRAFLGASRPTDAGRRRWAPEARDQRSLAGAPIGAKGTTRDPNPVTDFDPDDDLELADLRIGAGDNTAKYWGPHIICNTAMNLVGGGELAWRDRKAESFMLTPLHCGARSTGYARTPKDTGMKLSVGRAMSVSGAAVDPNMNYHQSTAVSMLLTIFNARLGVWIQNPNSEYWSWAMKGWRWEKSLAAWDAGSASYGGLLLKEFLGKTDECGSYVHISDGGHFDNLGVYELVKRRCRYIVAVDATENPLATSDNLGILVRLCRVDLGVRIELDTAPLKVDVSGGVSRAHVVVGRVRYDDVDYGQTPGMLIYIKSTMTGDEPPDVQQYANLHPEFPRQCTIDQSFDEDQFESYRTLGEHVARVVFEEAVQFIGEKWWEKNGADPPGTAFAQENRKIFGAVRNRWTEAPLYVYDRYMESTKSWRNLQRDLRSEPALARLARDFYPELAILDDLSEGPSRRAELHKMEQVIQFMEDAWTGLGLKDHDEAYIGRGWLNVFSRIAGSETFRLFWPLLRPECGPEFARFCERQLRANRKKPRLKEIRDYEPLVATLGAEFAREWPRVLGRIESSNGIDPTLVETLSEAGGRYLWDRINIARPEDTELEVRTAWLILEGPVEYEPSKESGFEFPIGIIALFPTKWVDQKVARANWAKDINKTYELFLWVRRAHRSAGVGERVLRGEEIEKLRMQLGQRRSSVLVQYPVAELCGAEDPERVRWLSFYSLFGFAPDQDHPLLPNEPGFLYKDYPEFTGKPVQPGA